MLTASAALIVGGFAAYAAAQSKVTLRFNLKNGQKLNYTSTMKITSAGMGNTRGAGGQGGTMDFDVTQSVVISEATSKGFTAKTKFVSNMQGRKQEQEVTAKYDSLGKVVSGGAGQGGMMGGMGPSGFMGMTYPQAAVGVGSTWTVDIDMKNAGGMGMGAQNMKGRIPVKYTVKSFGTKNGKRVANISANVSGTVTMGEGAQGMSMTMKGIGSSVVEVATGIVQEAVLNGDMTVSFNGQKMTSKIATKTVLK